VRITLGSRACEPAKHAAVMGADVRPCPVRDIVVDQKTSVVSTPAYMCDDARLADVAVGIDKAVRMVLSLARDRRPRPSPGPNTDRPDTKRPQPAAPPVPSSGPIVRKRPGSP
jgi:hypothetical protein